MDTQHTPKRQRIPKAPREGDHKLALKGLPGRVAEAQGGSTSDGEVGPDGRALEPSMVSQ